MNLQAVIRTLSNFSKLSCIDGRWPHKHLREGLTIDVLGAGQALNEFKLDLKALVVAAAHRFLGSPA